MNTFENFLKISNILRFSSNAHKVNAWFVKPFEKYDKIMHFRNFLKKLFENFRKFSQHLKYIVFPPNAQKIMHGLLNFLEKYAKKHAIMGLLEVGAPPPEGGTMFKKFVEISHVKLINSITFKQIIRFFSLIWSKYKNNWKFYPTMVFGGGAPDAGKLLIIPYIFLLRLQFFPKIRGSALKTQANNSLLGVKWGSVGKGRWPPEKI